MNTVEILKGAKALLETKGWTQGGFGRDASGVVVGLYNLSDANCFCGVGAAIVSAQTYSIPYAKAWEALSRAVGYNFPVFNDAPGRTKEEVLAVFDKAITAEEGRADA